MQFRFVTSARRRLAWLFSFDNATEKGSTRDILDTYTCFGRMLVIVSDDFADVDSVTVWRESSDSEEQVEV